MQKAFIRFSILLISTMTLLAQPEVPTDLIEELTTALSKGEYEFVVEEATSYLKQKDREGGVELVAPLLMEALVHQQNYSRFDRVQRTFLNKYPGSASLSRVYYLTGIVRANQRNYASSLKSFDKGFRALHNPDSNPKEGELLSKNFEKVVAVYVSKQELTQLYPELSSPQARAIAARYLGVLSGEEAGRPKKRKSDATLLPVVALMAPLTGEYSALGESALRTAELALEAHRNKTGEEFTLKVVDTKGKPVVVAQEMTKLLKDSVSFIIGPIMSNTATVAAAMLVGHPEVLMVSPTATDDGIAGLGENIYQLNLTSKALSEKIATYAVEKLNIKQFTVLSPISDYGETMTAHFVATAQSLGATINIVEYFDVKSHDHRKQFTAIREYFADQKFGATDTLDSLTAEMIKARETFLAESTIVVGGIFIPATADNVINIAAEVPFYKMQGQLLGVNGWHTKKLLTKGGTPVQNSFFATQEKVDQSGPRWTSFEKAYKERYNANPHKLVAPLVFDACQIILSSYAGCANTEEIRVKVNALTTYQGLSGVISLDEKTGVNSHAIIMKVSDQRFIRVQ